MNPRPNYPKARTLLVAFSAALSLLAGCAKAPAPEAAPAAAAEAEKKPEPPPPASVPLVASAEKSPHFDIVNRHLELGGTLYGYADIDGDMLSIADPIQIIAKNIAALQPGWSMFAKQDFKALISDLGLDDVKAVGLSSVRREDGLYRNRAFLYTPKGRHGMLAVFGGLPAPFQNTRLAPKDTDFYTEQEFDVVAIFETIKGIIAKVNGPQAAEDFEQRVKKAGNEAHFSLLDLIEGLNGRGTMFLRLNPTKLAVLPATHFTIPSFDGLVRVDGIGGAVEGMLQQAKGALEATTEGSLHLYTVSGRPAIDGMPFVLAVDGKTLYFATSGTFLEECLSRKDGLDTNPDFKAALAELGPDGNGLNWATPRFFSAFRHLIDMNEDASPEARRVLDLYAVSIPSTTVPLLALRTNLPDGILVKSTWNRSLKQDLALITIYNPVTVGLIAAMAVPAFQKARLDAQAVAVTNNLRALHSAAEAYYAEHGVTTATYSDLVGPDKALKAVPSVAGEVYQMIEFRKGRPLRIRLADGRIISFPPQLPRNRGGTGPGTNAPPPPPSTPFTPGADFGAPMQLVPGAHP
jgi:type IV pilus assembly protein PilA